MDNVILLGVLAAALAAVAAVFAFVAWRAAASAPQRLRLVLEQVLAGNRAEAEFLRTSLAATEGRLAAAIQSGTTDALSKAFEQIGAATQNVASVVDGLRRQAGEDAQKTTALLETRLAVIQASVNEKLHEAVEQQMTASFARVLEQFAQVQMAMGEVQNAAKQVGDLKRLFSNVKTRGGWGEAQLGALLEDIMPASAYERNFALKDGSRERVDFALRMPAREKLWLPMDAKFPTEDYERLLTAVDNVDADAERVAREGLAARIKLEAKKIREKYICPPETVDFGVLYLPSDSLFAEVARIPGLIDDVRARDKVMILGPTLLPAMLQTIHLGHITLDLEQRAGEIRGLLSATRREMATMDTVFEKLAKNTNAMSNSIAEARKRTRIIDKKLGKVEMVKGEEAQALLGLDVDVDEEE